MSNINANKDITERLEHFRHIFRDPEDVEKLIRTTNCPSDHLCEAAHAVKHSVNGNHYSGLIQSSCPSNQRRIFLTVQFLVRQLSGTTQGDQKETLQGSGELYARLASELEVAEPSLRGVTALALSTTVERISQDVLELDSLAALAPFDSMFQTCHLKYCRILRDIEATILSVRRDKRELTDQEKQQSHAAEVTTIVHPPLKRRRAVCIEDDTAVGNVRHGLEPEEYVAQRPDQDNIDSQDHPKTVVSSASSSVRNRQPTPISVLISAARPPSIPAVASSSTGAKMGTVPGTERDIPSSVSSESGNSSKQQHRGANGSRSRTITLEKRLDDLLTKQQGQQMLQALHVVQHGQQMSQHSQQEISRKGEVYNQYDLSSLRTIPGNGDLTDAREELRKPSKSHCRLVIDGKTLTPEAVRYLPQVIDTVKRIADIRRMLTWLQDTVFHFDPELATSFADLLRRSTLDTQFDHLGQRLKVRDILEFAEESWLSETCVDAIISYFKHEYGGCDILFIPARFLWHLEQYGRCEMAFADWGGDITWKKEDLAQRLYRRAYGIAGMDACHWGAVRIDLQEPAIKFGDSMMQEIPTPAIDGIVQWLICNIPEETQQWMDAERNVTRLPVIRQTDFGSCGIHAAAAIEQDLMRVRNCPDATAFYDNDHGSWEGQMAHYHRARYLKIITSQLKDALDSTPIMTALSPAPPVSMPAQSGNTSNIIDFGPYSDLSDYDELPESDPLTNVSADEYLVDITTQMPSQGQTYSSTASFAGNALNTALDGVHRSDDINGGAEPALGESDSSDKVIDDSEGVDQPLTFQQYALEMFGRKIEELDGEPWMPSIDFKFMDLSAAKENIKEWAIQFGFKTRTRRSSKTAVKIVCSHEGTHKAKKVDDPAKHRARMASPRCGCGFFINLTSPRQMGGSWRISSFKLRHNNHEMDATMTKYTVLDKTMKATIKKGFDLDMGERMTIKLLDERLLTLLNQQSFSATSEEWYYQADYDGFTLRRVFWMNPTQRALYSRYYDVVVLDATLQTNKLGMPLVLIIVIDCEFRSRLVACALTRSEAEEDYRWILEQLRCASGGVDPGVVFVDMDPSLDAAISQVWEHTRVINCLWHLRNNVRVRLQRVFGIRRFDQFSVLFEQALGALTPGEFERVWRDILSNFGGDGDGIVVPGKAPIDDNPLYGGTAGRYLKRLHSRRAHWAGPWIRAPFTAGVRSTQRAETTHSVIKRYEVTSSTTLPELFETIMSKVDNEVSRPRPEDIRILTETENGGIERTFRGVLSINRDRLSTYAQARLKIEMADSLTHIHRDEDIDRFLRAQVPHAGRSTVS
ncbi:zinc finger SWIM domain-containing protein 3 [Entomortierella parvispora]|uniref:Zinc finger SWIM domain-containing protein 3 n=1 Tax=Entomortierella parvispora TaxID=205924 RepID=A0A9P3H4Z5_9FUNG|nr:zinc finger SWIM domain-containing protein 3 [Entomortierella parvispora]